MMSAGDRQRLHTHAERVRTLQAELAAERERRDSIIRDLVDTQGHTYRAVARAAGLSVARVAATLSRH